MAPLGSGGGGTIGAAGGATFMVDWVKFLNYS